MKRMIVEKQSVPKTLKGIVLLRRQKKDNPMGDIGLLIFRLTIGGLLAGHGSQILFKWFGGSGLKGTAQMLESMELRPGIPWATAAAASQFGGGVLTGLGLLHPLGPIGTMGGMVVAIVKAHWGKPIWANRGGAELPITYLAMALGLICTGPGRFSLDRLFGIRLPRALVVTIASVEAALVLNSLKPRPTPAPIVPVEHPTPEAVTGD